MALTPLPQFAYPTNGWWAARNSDGSVVLIKGNNPGVNSVDAVYIGAANSINDLATTLGKKLSNAIGSIGASADQQATLISSIDTAAGKNSSTARILVAAKATPGTNPGSATDASGNPISDIPSGDAASAGINVPDPVAGVLGGIWTALTNPSNWLRALEVLGAVVAIYLGIRSLTGAPGVVETAEALKP